MDTNQRIPELKDAFENLRNSLGDEIYKQYNGVMKRYFTGRINKLKYDEEARKYLGTSEQIHLHNLFLLSLSNKIQLYTYNNYERIERMDFTPVHSPAENISDTQINNVKYVTQEMCLPYDDLVKGRIFVTALEHGLDGAEDSVTEVIVLAARIFIKNIITAMLSRTSGYKIRENNFQHGVGLPAPNPWLRNTSNIIDSTQESNITLNKEEQTFEPIIRNSLEKAQQQTAFGYSCSSYMPSNGGAVKLTLKTLYETLLYNPHIINNHSIQAINLERILSKLN